MLALPNILTIMRIVLVPVFALAFVLPGETARLIAFVVFCIAGVSDALDGLAARKLNAGSEFGRMLDPDRRQDPGRRGADDAGGGGIDPPVQPDHDPRLTGLLRLVPALIILSREILVSGLREFLAGAKVSVPVTVFAKFKTALQMVAIGAMILTPLADRFLPGIPAVSYSAFAYGLLWVAAALTVYTGYVYFRAGLRHLHDPRVLP